VIDKTDSRGARRKAPQGVAQDRDQQKDAHSKQTNADLTRIEYQQTKASRTLAEGPGRGHRATAEP